ncbi:MAG TPA: hypothetical protein VMH86_13985 [Rhizomicrobium sp.]|nr:hypothetical protein [Rhizomicrobium sp.]
MTTRRGVLRDLAIAVPLLAAWRTGALAATGRAALDGWARKVVALNRGLAGGEMGLSYWQDSIAALNASVPVGEVLRYLDIDRLTAHFGYKTRLADTAEVHFPRRVETGGIARPWFMRVFAMREGGAVIPHAHNNMVSAHLVVRGNFHARTFDRIRDEPDPDGPDSNGSGALVLRPSIDRLIGPGEIVTMSDDRDNSHWLVAQRSPSMTFDIGVVNISETRTYAIAANQYSMIYVDPTPKPQSDGLIHAPVLSFDAAAKRFAG